MRTKTAGRFRTLHRRFGVRLVLAMLAVCLPLLVVLVVLLTTSTATSLTDAGRRQVAGDARAAALRLEDWLGERDQDIAAIAAEAGGHADHTELARTLAQTASAVPAFTALQALDPSGRVVAAAGPKPVDAAGQEWLRTALSGKGVFTKPVERDGTIDWVVAHPVVDGNGKVTGVVMGNLDPTALSDLVADVDPDVVSEVVIFDDQRRLVVDSATMRGAQDAAALLAAGVLRTTIDSPVSRAVADGARSGTVPYTDRHGKEVVGAFEVVGKVGWVLVAKGDPEVLLGAARDQRKLAIVVLVLGALVATAASVLFAWRSSRPIARLTESARRAAKGDLSTRVRPAGPVELATLGESFNAMVSTCEQLVEQVTNAGFDVNSAAAQLSASSDQLAATTTQQSVAVTQATATTEELARASASIADTVDAVTDQTADTRENLEQAENDIKASSERTLALAGRVNDIDALLALINDIADQTNLLALNAAIEAARAGDQGRGFAVVAEEVRRLAERSKASVGDIASIIASIQAETNATVKAMETGSRKMIHGLELLDAVAQAYGEVRDTTQQQRSATAQVVDTMGQLADASRQVSSTAQQIAAAAGTLADLAGNLRATANIPVADQAALARVPVLAAGRGNGSR